jgi:hypothetical protein
MAKDPQMAVVDIIMDHWAKVFIGGILVKTIRGFLPTDLVIKLTYLTLDINL